MQQNDYTENLFRSVDTIIAERIKHLPYDTTQLMEITDDNNANAGIYKVKLDSSEQVIAYADNPKYQTGDQVYVLNTADGDRRFILGTFQKNPVGRIDRSNSELIALNNNVDKLLNTTEDINASLLILPEKFNLKLQSLDEKFTSLLELTEQKIDMRFSNVDKQLDSSFEMTAEMLQTQFNDEINGLHSSFLQTAEMFRTEVTDEFNQRWSSITQTADEIKSEVADDINGLYSVIDQTAGEIRSEVIDSTNSLQSLIDQTAGEIKLQVIDGLNDQQAALDILASGITARVEDIEKGYSEISQIADRISSRVEGLYGNYSQILQAADSITSRVEGIEGNYSEILQTADMIQSRVEDVEGNFSEIKQTASSISSTVKDIDEKYSNIEQSVDGLKITTSENGTSYINGSHIITGTITLNHLQPGDRNGIVFHSQLANENNTTTINGANIKTGTIDAHKVRLAWDNNGSGGGFTVANGNDGSGITYGAMMYGWQSNIDTIINNLTKDSDPDSSTFPNNYLIATNAGVRMQSYDTSLYCTNSGIHGKVNTSSGYSNLLNIDNGNVVIKNTEHKLRFSLNGDSIYFAKQNSLNNDEAWVALYSSYSNAATSSQNTIKLGAPHIHLQGTVYNKDGNVIHSDKNVKNNISYEMEKYENFYQLIKPVYYKLNEGTSDRYHIGYIYQDIESALLESGLTSQDFAGVVKAHQNNGELFCGLRYEEFIALNTHMIQKTRKELKEKDNKIQQLENKISELEQKLNLLLETLS